MVGNDLCPNARASLGKTDPKGVRQTPGVAMPSPGAVICRVLGLCGCPRGSGCGRRAREPALAQTMIQPTGRIISEELLDTMRKTFPNKAFSAPPASLLLASNLQALVTTTKAGGFVFPFPKVGVPGAQRAQDSILAPESNTEAASKAPGHVQLQPATSGLQTSGAGYIQNIQAKLPKESLKQIHGSEHTRCRVLGITACTAKEFTLPDSSSYRIWSM